MVVPEKGHVFNDRQGLRSHAFHPPADEFKLSLVVGLQQFHNLFLC